MAVSGAARVSPTGVAALGGSLLVDSPPGIGHPVDDPTAPARYHRYRASDGADQPRRVSPAGGPFLVEVPRRRRRADAMPRLQPEVSGVKTAPINRIVSVKVVAIPAPPECKGLAPVCSARCWGAMPPPSVKVHCICTPVTVKRARSPTCNAA